MQQSNCLVATKLLPLETVAFLASFLVGGLIGQVGRIGRVGLWFPEKGC